VVPLLATDDTHPPVTIAASQEREIAAIFVDLRESTRLAAGRLPYDALYIVGRYVTVVGRAVEAHGGQVTSVAGDGITRSSVPIARRQRRAGAHCARSRHCAGRSTHWARRSWWSSTMHCVSAWAAMLASP
jgi:class 3 adenylate cyclase